MFEKVMVVEDDEDIRSILTNKLLGYQYEVIEAKDGDEAIEKYQNQKPQIIVLDLMLPKLDGFGVLQKLRENEDFLKSTQVVIYSNFNDKEYVERAKRYNVADYLVKAQTEADTVCQRVQELVKDMR